MNPNYVLGFNEPENPDQANMTVAQAITSWKQISAAFTGTSTQLVSPAVADSPTGQSWLEQFMSQAKADNLKVNAVAFHWYDASTPKDPGASASQFIDAVNWYHDTFKLPVFITEFAINDWYGGYTAAQMQAGNQQFLNDVLPQLNSLSYVAGYSFYSWFPNTPLISGSPLTPTPMAYNYVGAVTSGSTANISGQDLGEHVAYLAGGTLTMNNQPGTVKYIDALANTSTITGGIDWSLDPASNSDWVRVSAGATLVKAGSNTITLGQGTITDDGTIIVTQGALNIGAPITGSGAVKVTGGTFIVGSTIGNPVTIGTGGVLAGGGSITSTVTVDGTIKAGRATAPETLNIQTLKIDNGSKIILVLNTPNTAAGTDGNSLIDAGNLTLGADVTLSLMHGYNFGAGVYHLLNATGTITGINNLDSWVITGPAPFTYKLSDPAGAINLTVTAAPEPTAFCLLLLGAMALTLRRRRAQAD
jgi:hypothetical protein